MTQKKTRFFKWQMLLAKEVCTGPYVTVNFYNQYHENIVLNTQVIILKIKMSLFFGNKFRYNSKVVKSRVIIRTHIFHNENNTHK